MCALMAENLMPSLHAEIEIEIEMGIEFGFVLGIVLEVEGVKFFLMIVNISPIFHYHAVVSQAREFRSLIIIVQLIVESHFPTHKLMEKSFSVMLMLSGQRDALYHQ